MKLIFAGTPRFAAVALDALVAAGFEIGLVLTQPDRPGGRGLRLQPSEVKLRALAHKLEIAQPASLKVTTAVDMLKAIGAEVMVVAAYGVLLPANVLTIPARGCLNIHASILPRWRGAAPIQRAILAGDRETGITIMQMDEGLDTGAILLQDRMAIEDDDTAQSVHDKLAAMGARMIVRALREELNAQPQDCAHATYAAKISKAEARIDWTRDALDICRQVRAFNPAPGASTTLDGLALKIWAATPVSRTAAEPGIIMNADATGILVSAGRNAVAISELQKAGGKRLPVGEFMAGTPLARGARLGT